MQKKNDEFPAVIPHAEVQVLLSRRLMNAIETLSLVQAEHMAKFLLDSGMVTVYTMFAEKRKK